MRPKSKLEKLKNKDLPKPQQFLAGYNLDECRLHTRMMDIPEDMSARYQGREACKACAPRARGQEGPEQYETRSHSENCEGFQHLWGQEMSERETTRYFLRLMRSRKKMSRRKL